MLVSEGSRYALSQRFVPSLQSFISSVIVSAGHLDLVSARALSKSCDWWLCTNDCTIGFEGCIAALSPRTMHMTSNMTMTAMPKTSVWALREAKSLLCLAVSWAIFVHSYRHYP